MHACTAVALCHECHRPGTSHALYTQACAQKCTQFVHHLITACTLTTLYTGQTIVECYMLSCCRHVQHSWHNNIPVCIALTTAKFCRCPTGTTLKGSSQTGHWGYWYDLLEPALVIGNDTVIDVEMPTFAAGQACKCSTEDFCLLEAYAWSSKTNKVFYTASLLATVLVLP